MSQRTADRRIGHTVRERPSRPFVDVNTKSTAKPLPKPSNPPTFRRSKTEPIQPVAVQGSSTNRKLLHPHWTPSDRDKNSTPPSPPDSRWSEVIPPHTALTFAAIWDPVEGMVAFSGAQLRDFLDKDVSFNTRPTSPGDGDSQILTIDRFALPSTVNSAALALDMERMPMTFACEAVMEPDTYADIFLRPGWQTPTPLPEPEQSSPKPPRSRSAVFASLLRQLPPDTMGELHWSKTEKDSLDSPRYDFVKGMMGSISSKGSSKQSGRVFGPVYEKSVTDEGFFEGRDNRISMGSGEAVMVEVNLRFLILLILVHPPGA
ncbi:hypothetical protein JAAARDRAFT_51474 [Jaapia argillacea MUCL 33604]|uniref:Uncharacterized protein n=1 Tax=Jaapia argillacea MUCL 33604 TaxID=933084 RepID=A0A067PHR1_9AGAM|nr:hypothetical protein JAAARDRAFT_51474 [Jaapia argillacea MUCL 33604]